MFILQCIGNTYDYVPVQNIIDNEMSRFLFCTYKFYDTSILVIYIYLFIYLLIVCFYYCLVKTVI